MIKAEVVFLQQHLSCIDRLGIPVHSAIISEHIVAMFSIPCVYVCHGAGVPTCSQFNGDEDTCQEHASQSQGGCAWSGGRCVTNPAAAEICAGTQLSTQTPLQAAIACTSCVDSGDRYQSLYHS